MSDAANKQLPEPEESTEADGDVGRMSFVDHLRELRRRLFYCVVVLVVLTFVAFAFAEPIFAWITSPLAGISDQKMQVLGLMEMFLAYMKLAVLAAIFASAPFWLVQAWLFIAPGLYAHEKRWIVPFVVMGTVFFIGGGAFGFYVVLPLGFEQLVVMVPENVEANYRVSDYISLVLHMLVAFGAVFELPLVMWILSAAGIVSPPAFARFRKYWLILAFVIGGVLTPPDPFTQILMAVPLLLFFELGLVGARIVYQKHQEREGST